MAFIPPLSQVSGSGGAPESGKQVQQIVNEHCKGYPTQYPLGCNVVVMQEGKEAVLYKGGEMPENAPINWGSVSKQFTAACIDLLVKLGLIKYDDDIRILCPDLPEFKLNGKVQKVTVDDLLHMRSGLPEVGGISLMQGVDAELLENAKQLSNLEKHPGMVFAPGEKFMYCNTNYYILAKIVEKMSGRSFPDFVREKILVPLNMGARCSVDSSSPKTIAGYECKDGKWKDVTSPNKSYGATGLIGPPSDMIAWNAAMAQRTYDLLDPPKKREFTEDNYCRGVVVDYVEDYRVISHGGALSGANTLYRRYEHTKDPNKTFALFFTTNNDNIPAMEKTTDRIANAIAGKDLTLPRFKAEPPPKWQASQEQAKPYCGTFRCRELGSDWLIKEEDLKDNWGLLMTPPKGPTPPEGEPEPFRPDFLFQPQIKGDQFVFRSEGFGSPVVELTPTGLTITCENIAPLHFDRI